MTKDSSLRALGVDDILLLTRGRRPFMIQGWEQPVIMTTNFAPDGARQLYGCPKQGVRSKS